MIIIFVQIRGLAYIFQTFREHEVITQKDVISFLSHLRLPPMDNDELFREMKEAGGEVDEDDGGDGGGGGVFRTLKCFFAFIVNQLKPGIYLSKSMADYFHISRICKLWSYFNRCIESNVSLYRLLHFM